MYRSYLVKLGILLLVLVHLEGNAYGGQYSPLEIAAIDTFKCALENSNKNQNYETYFNVIYKIFHNDEDDSKKSFN